MNFDAIAVSVDPEGFVVKAEKEIRGESRKVIEEHVSEVCVGGLSVALDGGVRFTGTMNLELSETHHGLRADIRAVPQGPVLGIPMAGGGGHGHNVGSDWDVP